LELKHIMAIVQAVPIEPSVVEWQPCFHGWPWTRHVLSVLCLQHMFLEISNKGIQRETSIDSQYLQHTYMAHVNMVPVRRWYQNTYSDSTIVLTLSTLVGVHHWLWIPGFEGNQTGTFAACSFSLLSTPGTRRILSWVLWIPSSRPIWMWLRLMMKVMGGTSWPLVGLVHGRHWERRIRMMMWWMVSIWTEMMNGNGRRRIVRMPIVAVVVVVIVRRRGHCSGMMIMRMSQRRRGVRSSRVHRKVVRSKRSVALRRDMSVGLMGVWDVMDGRSSRVDRGLLVRWRG